ncbi:hypothetical protein ACFPOD_04505 [Nitratireductor kimnyeongensis]|uniref:Uncharacterized protein n=1 Tax=Nitratireductor kimnyeongensis TaxID=430679 RepID=A0ABW0T5U4_9HYPH|nr:hypothetical protein [Nitratireductor kimnyeongensis]QZZ34648.1 hypothetical protein KW403_12690 [Nitratireductor kimnyeongensis]
MAISTFSGVSHKQCEYWHINCFNLKLFVFIAACAAWGAALVDLQGTFGRMTIGRATVVFLITVSAFTLIGARLLSAGASGDHHPVDGYGISAAVD